MESKDSEKEEQEQKGEKEEELQALLPPRSPAPLSLPVPQKKEQEEEDKKGEKQQQDETEQEKENDDSSDSSDTAAPVSTTTAAKRPRRLPLRRRVRLRCGHETSLARLNQADECPECKRPLVRLDLVPVMRGPPNSRGRSTVIYLETPVNQFGADHRLLDPMPDVLGYKIVSVIVSDYSPRLYISDAKAKRPSWFPTRSSIISSSSSASDRQQKKTNATGLGSRLKSFFLGGGGSDSGGKESKEQKGSKEETGSKEEKGSKQDKQEQEREDEFYGTSGSASASSLVVRVLEMGPYPNPDHPKKEHQKQPRKYAILDKVSALLTMQLSYQHASIFYTEQPDKKGIVPLAEMRNTEKYCTNAARVVGLQFIGDPEQCKTAMLAYASGHAFLSSYFSTGSDSTIRTFEADGQDDPAADLKGKFLYELGQESIEQRAGQNCGNGSCGAGIYFFLDRKSALNYWKDRNRGYSDATHVPVITRKILDHEYRQLLAASRRRAASKRGDSVRPTKGALVVAADPQHYSPPMQANADAISFKQEDDDDQQEEDMLLVERRKRRSVLEAYVNGQKWHDRMLIDPRLPPSSPSSSSSSSSPTDDLLARQVDKQKSDDALNRMHEKEKLWEHKQLEFYEKLHLYVNKRFDKSLRHRRLSPSSSSFKSPSSSSSSRPKADEKDEKADEKKKADEKTESRLAAAILPPPPAPRVGLIHHRRAGSKRNGDPFSEKEFD
jgi:hypothetical protein